ncbi:Polyprenol reductase 1 [Acorus calamus]|uniref:Polyprenol reductase 1 n=1 Tax=Acorus calamus TaxID=4465 RepID=A0AAV9CE61_ACOCL|nr:Polyprenol reductase 1 [Acorus calamus]
MSAISLVSLANAGVAEVRGRHLQYSKFWDSQPNKVGIKISSRAGMFALYAPAAIAGLVSFGFPAVAASPRGWLLSLALSVHFLKRVFEVLFVHQYSGAMILDSVIPISLSYFLSTVTAIYAQYLTQGLPEPEVDLKYAGIALFLLGISGNFYHHLILSKLRNKDDKGYKIPKGGLFGLVICPHYLFEIIDFVGISCISQTLYVLSFTLGTVLYLMGRSYATRRWYLSKFPNFPKNVKALIPFVF